MVSVSGCWDGLPHACCDAMMLIKERDGPLWTALLYNVTGLAERQGRRQKLGGVGGGGRLIPTALLEGGMCPGE